MAEFVPVPSFDLVVFGASGDLALRKLFPSLFHRFKDGQIPSDSRIVGVARQMMTKDAFRKTVSEGFASLAKGDPSTEAFQAFLSLIDYVALDATKADGPWDHLVQSLAGGDDKVRVFYLSTPPSVFGGICAQLRDAGLVSPASRVVLEKPLGRDLMSAKAINDAVAEVFSEDRVYRIDHYLGKETVQNLLVLRFANALFEPVWSRASIDHVQITVAETIGVGSRGDYYDKSGAMRDMVQNHLLQLLCLVAMEPPNSVDADAIRTEKIKVLQALVPIGPADIASHSVRGQYRAGLVENEPVKGYLEDLGPDRTSSTETYVALKAEISNWRWSGVPFYLRTGKRLPSRRSEIVVTFRPPPHSLFGNGGEPNQLVMRLQPDEGMEMWLQIKEPGPGGLRVKSVPLDLSYETAFTLRYPDAYERLLMDVVRGNLSLFMRKDEVESAWAWVDQVIAAWESAGTQPDPYAAGSDGPLQAALLMDRDGRKWRDLI
ncbi:MAG: glucose-6-phosphate dehydrogenase [Aquidulcibacter sp.]|jgi:glucose-6-phosphate 1-dehydrogenase|uniref:glucose-6-phosphate dehydrogenase n=1 Tax=Aquidulcibacter sp. TaxID=2052990 RepID=UPI0022C9C90E|nr:glucose-6-phosphate dehydrogenase [Aquidulcibacter sp.]